jgi:rubrerythrin
MELNGSKNKQNLNASLDGELQADHKYTYNAAVAKEKGLEQGEGVSQETAKNKIGHAKRGVDFKDKKVKWRCPDCPYVSEGNGESDGCPGLCV